MANERNGSRSKASEDRAPPSNLEAEMSVVGSLLLDSERVDDVVTIVKPEDFHNHACGRLFESIVAMHEANKPIDLTLLVNRIKKAGELESVGGRAFIGEVAESVGSSANAAYYARIVRDNSILRGVIHASEENLDDARAHSAEAAEVLSRSESRLMRILESHTPDVQVTAYHAVMHAAEVFMATSEGDQERGIPTGLIDLDEILDGMKPGALVVLAARPSMGKTALACNIADHCAVDRKIPTLIFSMEMGSLEIGDRLLFARIRVPIFRARELSTEDKRKINEGASAFFESPLYIDDSPHMGIREMGAIMRRMRRKHGIRLVVIDYLQLIVPDDPRVPRQEQVAGITRRLKGLAREMSVPILCLAQLNRKAEETKDNRPLLSHLRESGAIEQDADVVMFIHREEVFCRDESRKDELKGQADIIVAKQRNGRIGDVKVTWNDSIRRFDNAPKYRQAWGAP